MVAAGWPRCKRPEPGLERVWFDFRNAFGVMWALRVAQRMNTAAQRHGWHVSLTWKGFEVAERGLDDKLIGEAIQPAMSALLLRFVSSDWIDLRLKPYTRRDDSRRSSPSEA
jgi:hypothetical protein